MIEKISMKWKKLTFRNILYGFRVFLLVAFLILVFFLLPNILEAGWQGKVLLGIIGILILVTLWAMLSGGSSFKDRIGYNLLYIGAILYLGLIWGRLFFDERVKMTLLYQVDMNYFKNNYLILSIVLLGIIFNTLLFLFDDQEGKIKKSFDVTT